MPAKPSLDQLKRRHAALEAQIAEEEARPHPDDVKLATFKKQKLMLKDAIAMQQHEAAA